MRILIRFYIIFNILVNINSYSYHNYNKIQLNLKRKSNNFVNNYLSNYLPNNNVKSSKLYMNVPQTLYKKVFNRFSEPINRIKSLFNNPLYRQIVSMLYPKDNLKIRLYFIGSIVFLYLSKWYNLQVPFIYQRTIDLISVSNKLTTKVNKQITLAIISYGLSRALSVIFSEIKTCLFTHVSQNIIKKFATQIFTQIHMLNTEFHVMNPSGVLSVAYVRSIRGLQSLLFEIIFSVLPMFLELFLSIYILYSRYSYPYALVTLLTFSLYMVYTVFITQFKIKIRTDMIKTDSERNAYLIDSILNHELIKLFNNYLSEINKYSTNYISKIEKLFIDTTYSVALLNLGQTLIFGIGLISMLLLAVNDLLKGKITLGELVAINAMLMQLSVPFNWVGMTYQEVREAIVDISYMSKVFSETNQPSNNLTIPVSTSSISNYLTDYLTTGENLNYLSDRHTAAKIEFNDVSFSYTNGSNILKNLTFTINPGENVAIVGPSGSGKSTALRLVSRLYEPTSGQIQIDNQPLDKLSLSSLRERISVIPQDTSLFDNTIDYNIRYGNRYLDSSHIDSQIDSEIDSKIDGITGIKVYNRIDSLTNYYNGFINNNPNSNLAKYLSNASQNNITNHLTTYLNNTNSSNITNHLSEFLVNDMIEKVQLSDVINRLPDGLDTMVGERGARLSGGERQKVSIARALLRQPTLILCDEMTSSIDAFSEREIITLIRDINKKQNITVITIAHRLASVIHCDKILVINNGSLIEMGNHNDLINNNGLYKSMWLSQNYGMIDNDLDSYVDISSDKLDSDSNSKLNIKIDSNLENKINSGISNWINNQVNSYLSNSSSNSLSNH